MMYDISKYYKIGTTEKTEDLRSTNHLIMTTEIYTNGENYMVLENKWQSYVGTTRNRVFLKNKIELYEYTAYYFINGMESIKPIDEKGDCQNG